MAGFVPTKEENVRVSLGGIANLRMTMQLECMTTGVPAVGDADVPVIEPTESSAGNRVTYEELIKVPTARDPWAVLTLVPQTQAAVGPTPSEGGGAVVGDGNGDENVDARDYDVWRANFGNTEAQGATAGDYDGNGSVDARDYVVWRSNAGQQNPGGGNVVQHGDIDASGGDAARNGGAGGDVQLLVDDIEPGDVEGDANDLKGDLEDDEEAAQ